MSKSLTKNILLVFFILLIIIGCGGDNRSSVSNSTPLTDQEAMEADKSSLVISCGGNETLERVTQNLTLFLSGSNGTIISWMSSNPAVISDAGVVSRPAYGSGNVDVVMTAIITMGISRSIIDLKLFTVTVLETPVTDEEAVEADEISLTITYGIGDRVDSVTQNIGLPTSGSSGTSILWSSDDTNVITDNGIVSRPLFSSGNSGITLTATISKGEVSDTKEFILTVIETPRTDLEAVYDDLTSLAISYDIGDGADTITQNVGLAGSGSSGTEISWSSDNISLVTDNGTVTRPVWKSDVNMVLTATVSKGVESRVKQFNVKVETIYSILKTGQDVSSTDFDDGSYQKGIARDFSRNDITDIITDNITGLMWQDDSDVSDNLKLKNWSEAVEYCTSLPLGGYTDWRLPDINELKLIVDYSKYNSAITDPVFQNVASNYYWSSTTAASSTDYAWVVSFNYGHDNGYHKTSSYYVRCVRGGQLIFDDLMIRDNSAEVVMDRNTDLIWQDNADVNNQKNWSDAINYCEDLELGGYDDWRLPNINELKSMVDYSKYDPAINESVFQNVASSYYWSSTTAASNTDGAWVVYFSYGYDSYNAKTSSYYVRCVRGGQ